MAYRIQHSETKLGIFAHCDFLLFKRNTYLNISIGFKDMNTMDEEFNHRWGDMQMFKCAFKNALDLLKYVPVRYIPELFDFGFEVVEIKGKVKKANHQAFFVDSECEVKVITIESLLEKAAKEAALKDINNIKILDYEKCYLFES